MVMELERLRDRLTRIGLEEVAQDVNTVLEKHREILPSHLPGAVLPNAAETTTEVTPGITFEYDREILPINETTIEDPMYLRAILFSLFNSTATLGFNKILKTHALYAIMRETKNMKMGHDVSFMELLSMSDTDLMRLRNLGKKGLGLFRTATQSFRERFIDRAIT